MSTSSVLRSLDWSRLAEPQTDQYDTEAILQLVSSTTSAERPERYRRTPVGQSPAVFDGQVAVRHVYRSLPAFGPLAAQYPDAPADHANVVAAAEHVRHWPLGFAQCQRLLEAIHPALDPQMPVESAEIYRGSSCHSFERLFGTMWATIFCPIGLAEAIVHEMAHQKLRALGVSVESATTVVGNDPSALYGSPIIKDRLRPMTAVLHAEYSYVHVTTLDIHLLQAEHDPARRHVLRGVLERNLSRIEEGYATLRRHYLPGEHGQEFIEGLYRWTETVIAAARTLLDRKDHGAGSSPPTPVVGSPDRSRGVTIAPPLPCIDNSNNVVCTPDRTVELLLTFNEPRIALIGNVLSDEECDALVSYCEPRLARSSVVSDADGNVQVHPNRTSRGVMLHRHETALVARIEDRLAALTQWPVEHSEGLQVLRYGPGDEYRPHVDWISPDVPGLRGYLATGGQRLATLILYLSQVESGGSTSFPGLGLEVMPKKGAAVFFVNTNTEHVPDPLTLHASSPVIRGVKFVANKWLREREC